jgi:hypothetical protein
MLDVLKSNIIDFSIIMIISKEKHIPPLQFHCHFQKITSTQNLPAAASHFLLCAIHSLAKPHDQLQPEFPPAPVLHEDQIASSPAEIAPVFF